MVTNKQRKFIIFMVKIKLWRVENNLFGMPEIIVNYNRLFILTKRLKNWLLKKQIVDNFHHAPGCHANHYHNTRFVFKYCSCGASKYSHLNKPVSDNHAI